MALKCGALATTSKESPHSQAKHFHNTQTTKTLNTSNQPQWRLQSAGVTRGASNAFFRAFFANSSQEFSCQHRSLPAQLALSATLEEREVEALRLSVHSWQLQQQQQQLESLHTHSTQHLVPVTPLISQLCRLSTSTSTARLASQLSISSTSQVRCSQHQLRVEVPQCTSTTHQAPGCCGVGKQWRAQESLQ